MVQQDRELVTAQARDQVVGADLPAEALGDDLQHLVPDVVAQPVVDLLEAVEVDQHDREHPALAAGLIECLLHLLVEQPAVR